MMLLIYIIGCVAFVTLIWVRIKSFVKNKDGFYLSKKCAEEKCSHDKLWKCVNEANNVGLAYTFGGVVLGMFVAVFPEYGLYWILKIDILVGS